MAAMSAPSLLCVRLCFSGIGVGDGLRSHNRGRSSSAWGTALNAVKGVAQCSCCVAGVGATGRKAWRQVLLVGAIRGLLRRPQKRGPSCRNGVVGDMGAVAKSSTIGARGEKYLCI